MEEEHEDEKREETEKEGRMGRENMNEERCKKINKERSEVSKGQSDTTWPRESDEWERNR